MPTTPSQYDIDHAVFVREAYRYAIQTAPAVKARNPLAREVTLNTNLDQASAIVIGQAILQENAQPRAFEIVLEGTAVANSLAGGPPSFVLNSGKVGDTTARKAFSEVVDYDKNRTTFQVRG